MKRVFAHIGFSFALTMLVLNLVNTKYIPLLAAGLAVLLAVSLLLRHFRQAVAVPLCLGSALLACLVFLTVWQSTVLPVQSLDGQMAHAVFYVTDLPVYNGKNYYYTVRAKEILMSGAPQNILLRLQSEVPITAKPYTLIDGEITFSQLADNAFDSYGYWSDRVFLNGVLTDFDLRDEAIASPMKAVLWLRNDMIETLFKVVKGDEGALAAAMVTGDKFYVSEELYTAFQYAGASHLMAISGLHLSVVTGVAYWLFNKLLRRRKAASVITVAVTVLYMALAGFSSSIVRAGIMMLVLHGAVLVNRRADALNSLGIAVFLLCLNPFAVCDAGAVLSVLSVLAILTAQPYQNKIKHKMLRRKMHRNKAFFVLYRVVIYVLQSVMISGFILLFTMPAMYVFFDYVTFAGLVANLILIPLGSAATVVSLLTYLAVKTKILAAFAVLICRFTVKLLILFVKGIAAIEAFTLAFDVYFGLVAAGILVVFAFCFLTNRKQQLKTALLLTVIALTVTFAVSAYQSNNTTSVLITPNGTVMVINHKAADVYNIKTMSDYYSLKHLIKARRLHVHTLYDCQSKASKSFAAELPADEVVPIAALSGITVGDFEIRQGEDGLYDNYGKLNLSDGDIIYSFKQDGSYHVRRLE